MSSDPHALAAFVQARGERLDEARKQVQQSHESLLKTKKKLNDALIEQKRAEAAIEEIKNSQVCTRTYKQAGRAFIMVPKDDMVEDLHKTVKTNAELRTQFGELERKMEERLVAHKADAEKIQQELIRDFEKEQKAKVASA